MAEYIEREALKKKKVYSVERHEYIVPVAEIDWQPAADVERVMHGRWVLEQEPNGKPYCYHCSVCDEDFRRIDIKVLTPYCPYCGAKMDAFAERSE